MSKRFTDTEKWRRPWFRNLPAPYREFWQYVLDTCDVTGIWYVDFGLASYLLGSEVNPMTAQELLQKQIVVLNGGSRWYVKDFIDFQYGRLNEKVPFHARIISVLKKDSLMASLPARVQVTLEDKDIDKDKDIKGVLGGFEIFYKHYPRKQGKIAALKAWKHLNESISLDDILDGVRRWRDSEQWKDPKFIPLPASFINGRRWEDEVINGTKPKLHPSALA